MLVKGWGGVTGDGEIGEEGGVECGQLMPTTSTMSIRLGLCQLTEQCGERLVLGGTSSNSIVMEREENHF